MSAALTLQERGTEAGRVAGRAWVRDCNRRGLRSLKELTEDLPGFFDVCENGLNHGSDAGRHGAMKAAEFWEHALGDDIDSLDEARGEVTDLAADFAAGFVVGALAEWEGGE